MQLKNYKLITDFALGLIKTNMEQRRHEQQLPMQITTAPKGNGKVRAPTEAQRLQNRVYASGLQRMTTKTTNTSVRFPAGTSKRKTQAGLRRRRGGGAIGNTSLLPTRRQLGREDDNFGSLVFTSVPSAPFGIKPSRPRPRDNNPIQQAVGPRTRSLLKVEDAVVPQQQQQQKQRSEEQQSILLSEDELMKRELQYSEREGDQAREFEEAAEQEEQNMYDLDGDGELDEWEQAEMEEAQVRRFHMEQREKEETQRLHSLLLNPPADSLFEKLRSDSKWDLTKLKDNGFLYLAARPTNVASSHPNSFDLMIMSHRKIKETDPRVFFVLSKDGVTMYTYDVPDYKKEQQARKPQPLHTLSAPEVEYMTLDDFEQAYEYHKHIMKIPFFRLYRKWKSLRTWRSAVRGRKMRSVRASLGKKLFLLDPVL